MPFSFLCLKPPTRRLEKDRLEVVDEAQGGLSAFSSIQGASHLVDLGEEELELFLHFLNHEERLYRCGNFAGLHNSFLKKGAE